MVDSWGKTLIVIPAFNEEDSVASVIAEVRSHAPGVGILVVSDGSRDRTVDIAQRAGALVADLPYNLGVGGAMRVGFVFARRNGYENVVQVDADGQHDAADLAKLIAGLKKADLIVGARFSGVGEYRASGPRWWAMLFLSKVLSKIAHTELRDTTSGFRASGPKAVQLFAEHYPAEYLGDTVESLVIAAKAGLVIRQVPVSMRERAAGEASHHPVRAAVFLARVGLAMLFALLRPSVKV
jgi:glycosyltransferase involved in cell wall biosynthesis